jgi:hypothetical protein
LHKASVLYIPSDVKLPKMQHEQQGVKHVKQKGRHIKSPQMVHFV